MENQLKLRKPSKLVIWILGNSFNPINTKRIFDERKRNPTNKFGESKRVSPEIIEIKSILTQEEIKKSLEGGYPPQGLHKEELIQKYIHARKLELKDTNRRNLVSSLNEVLDNLVEKDLIVMGGGDFFLLTQKGLEIYLDLLKEKLSFLGSFMKKQS